MALNLVLLSMQAELKSITLIANDPDSLKQGVM